LIIAGVVLLLVAVGDIGLGLAVMFGRNWARILLMLSSVVAVITAFIGNANGSEIITLGTLPTVGMSILVLLALSSHRAREYATRSQPTASGGWSGIT
jgi:4-hydroxybenzoate polyprenyltransferase